MNRRKPSPRVLIELLAEEGPNGRKLRAELHKNPRKVLREYGIEPPKRIPKPVRLPSPKRVKAALAAFDDRGFKSTECLEVFVDLILRIGAIPFVADGAR